MAHWNESRDSVCVWVCRINSTSHQTSSQTLTESSGGLWILGHSTDGPFTWRNLWKRFLKPSKSFLDSWKTQGWNYVQICQVINTVQCYWFTRKKEKRKKIPKMLLVIKKPLRQPEKSTSTQGVNKIKSVQLSLFCQHGQLNRRVALKLTHLPWLTFYMTLIALHSYRGDGNLGIETSTAAIMKS